MLSESERERASALLVCAGGGIGDSLLASVVARALHARFARVDALTLPGHRETLERVPDVDGVLVDDGGEERDVAQRLAQRGYAAAIVTWATARSARLIRFTGIPERVGQGRRLYSALFTKRVIVRSERGDVTSHWTQVLLDYARALGCDTANPRPRFLPTDDDEREARSAMERYDLEPGQFLIMHPSNAIASQRSWPTDGWRRLARALRARFAVPVVVTGSLAERSIVEAVCDEQAIPLAGELGVGAFGALARASRAYVGITTGVMHVAAAVGAPTLGIFPFQSDFPERWAPIGEKTAVVRPSYRCHVGDSKEHCRDYACIQHLDVDRILMAAEALLR